MKVLLIDDHPLIVAALESVLRGLRPDIDVTSAVCGRTGREALRHDPDIDLVLLDLQLGDADGFELLAEFRAAYPSIPVVVISASDRTSDVIRAIDLGAMGFVPKRTTHGSVLDALRQVIEGGVFVPPMSMGEERHDAPCAHHGGGTLSARAEPLAVRHVASGHARPVTSLASLGLTPRQTDVLALLLKGLSNKLIARELDVSVETVKDHVAAVLRALKVSSRTQAVIAVSELLQQQGPTGGTGFSAWGVTAPGPHAVR